ncbi:MAG: tRNA (N(6)-L-threonylcarbamoyladenosine(37)-C(2))-methylthiotransferase MtaB [Prolixibacteraceae bacterium]|jgi:threonylcarbamoyladenosine tRNA methylthiotransferase MtaB|nr:tRNA (N(6)-L-threonylcarbamoyladenosine(37)-C(2))-methylthiotransferase MtaB [Prolixibacteraceae bacterium]MBT6004699.1 tRNA (N(6)-L-threonylcarbamoyladenosine(37)-C(2))-methylthiotransferase MtaB [Prolixibacteraceae bacterium]MBT6765092.1 tRNA (N(6)-L-threonylcarbamoyladenosine(37)-C(2))-methylthiotransferase MtaB [Prolixibacteraceae bacterium]MBT6997784.1 tRNA (N(6)-L-threonylcarbamoyladenosine(37)-C(2))-methylthiotransferase MtaB [Prolixibacteraceae bacterium]MBT7396424.1 tRNA (N(6)-L-thr
MDYKGKKAAFYTLGCKLNFSETSTIAASFKKVGFEPIDFKEKADVYVINTCSVTNQGDKASRNIIRQAVKKNPEAMVIVVGCYSQLKPEEVGHIEGVDLVLGTQEKFHIPAFLGNLEKRETTEIKTTRLANIKNYHKAFSWGDRTRSFLKIQDGCDYYCSFCTIPFARGKSRNDNIQNTVAEAKKAIEKGFKEIILTGVNIGDFGKSTGENFLNLLKALEKVEGLKRLRLGSIEPNLLKNDIIKLVSKSKVIMPHFHLPLQSGSDEVLSLMKRKYSTGLFSQRIKRIREIVPNAFIGVDIIAGTNGETEELFQESYDFINSLEISQLHAFTYSERSGTQALKIPWKVEVKDRKRRTQMYINLSEKKLRAFYENHLGTSQIALFEAQKNKEKMVGFTGNYIKVEVPYQENLVNKLGSVKLNSILPNGNVAVEIE